MFFDQQLPMITWTVHNSSVVNFWAREALKNSWMIRLSCQNFSLGGERYRGAATHPRAFLDFEAAKRRFPQSHVRLIVLVDFQVGWARLCWAVLVTSSYHYAHCTWISWRIHVCLDTFSRLRDDKVSADAAIDEWFVGLLCWHVRFACKVQVYQFTGSNESISNSSWNSGTLN